MWKQWAPNMVSQAINQPIEQSIDRSYNQSNKYSAIDQINQSFGQLFNQSID